MNRYNRYYTYRLKEPLLDFKKFEIQDLPIELLEGDKLIVFIAGSMEVLGSYIVSDNKAIIETKINDMKLSDFYDCFSFITEIGERTYKIFAKPVREISKDDYINILSKI